MQHSNDRWSIAPWMTPSPLTITEKTPIDEAFDTMNARGFRHLLVVDQEGLCGIVSDRDLRSANAQQTRDPSNKESPAVVGTVMSTALKTIQPEEKLEKAIKLMLFHKINALPVVEKDGSLVGILTSQDVIAAFAATLDDFGPALRGQ